MTSSRLPDDAHIGHVHLQVSDLGRSLEFYVTLLGFQEVKREDGTAVLSATGDPPYHVLLTERPGARRKPDRTTGLYHFAIRYPNRLELARTFRRLRTHSWRLGGASDHKVSEALYLDDPDGNGLELYRDRPRERWPWAGDQVTMTTDPLDLESLVQEVADDTSPWTGIHPEADIGHVHLHVSDLGKAEGFYCGALGLAVTQRTYPGALFVSAGGYHHHVGMNVWAGQGAPPPPPDAAGLLSFALHVPGEAALEAVLARAEEAGVSVEERRDYAYAHGVLLRDEDRNAVELLVVD